MRKIICTMFSILLLLTACSQRTLTWQDQYDLGVRYLSEGNYKEAIIAFTAAIEIEPTQALIYVNRGNAYLLSENLAAAQEDFEISIELDDMLVDAYIGLADVYTSYGDYDKALEILQLGFRKSLDDRIKDKIHELLSNTDYFVSDERVIIDFSKYLTNNMITKEEFTLGGIPFCNLSIEEAVQFLPSNERGEGIVTGSTSYLGTYREYIACYLYTLPEPATNGFIQQYWSYPMRVLQRDDESTLSIIGYDGSTRVDDIEVIKSEAREIATGDSLELFLQKIGVSTEGSSVIASTILQFGEYSVASFDFDSGVFTIYAIEEQNPPVQINFLYGSNKIREIHSDFDSLGRMTQFSVIVDNSI